MFAQLFNLVVGSLTDFLVIAFLTRFVMQWARASFRNPIGTFVIAITDWAVRPVRKLVPGLLGLDWSSFLLAWLTKAAYISIVVGIIGMYGGATAGAVGAVIGGALVEVVRLVLYLAMGVIIVMALLSWINPYAPVAPLFNHLAAPLLRPVQRFLPPIGGVDLSPMVVMLILVVLQGQLEALRLPIFR